MILQAVTVFWQLLKGEGPHNENYDMLSVLHDAPAANPEQHS